MSTNDSQVLSSCPFCGGEAEYGLTMAGEEAYCKKCHAAMPRLTTKAEAIAAWNSRAAMEFDNWFYLPKPKEGIVDYGEPEITRTENGYKVRQIASVVDEAARKWGEELGEYVMRRICEIWDSRAERTCEVESKIFIEGKYVPCPYYEYEMECGGQFRWDDTEPPSHCPNCGARVIG